MTTELPGPCGSDSSAVLGQLLPKPWDLQHDDAGKPQVLYTADQMRSYADAAVASERERRRALATDFQEYLYRVSSQVPFEHAEWAHQRGEALLVALRA